VLLRQLALGMMVSAGLLERSGSGCTVAVNMSELDSGLVAAQLPPEKLPVYHAHHGAKHELLRRYMDVWMPKLGFTHGQIALVDGFASAGRYREGERGSPFIILDAYVGRSASDRARFKSPPHLVFIESRKDYAQNLTAEVESYPTLHGATVDVIHGSYEVEFPKVVAYLASAYRQPVPTFAFIDPRGYADNPFSHIADFKGAMPNKSEVMVYLPASFMARFLETGITDEALTKLYGGPTWEEAKALDEQSRQRVGQKLAVLFGDRLKEHFNWVTSFNVEPERHNDYYLLFGTDHKDGLRAMKQGMWRVDAHGGEGFKQAKVLPEQGQLFPDAELTAPPDTSILGELLSAEFADRIFTITEAEDFTLCRTRYLDKPHLRAWALRALEQSNKITVIESSRSRKGDYPAGTTMRFTQ
jgi:three-Cys-motif partner protein